MVRGLLENKAAPLGSIHSMHVASQNGKSLLMEDTLLCTDLLTTPYG